MNNLKMSEQDMLLAELENENRILEEELALMMKSHVRTRSKHKVKEVVDDEEEEEEMYSYSNTERDLEGDDDDDEGEDESNRVEVVSTNNFVNRNESDLLRSHTQQHQQHHSQHDTNIGNRVVKKNINDPLTFHTVKLQNGLEILGGSSQQKNSVQMKTQTFGEDQDAQSNKGDTLNLTSQLPSILPQPSQQQKSDYQLQGQQVKQLQQSHQQQQSEQMQLLMNSLFEDRESNRVVMYDPSGGKVRVEQPHGNGSQRSLSKSGVKANRSMTGVIESDTVEWHCDVATVNDSISAGTQGDSENNMAMSNLNVQQHQPQSTHASLHGQFGRQQMRFSSSSSSLSTAAVMTTTAATTMTSASLKVLGKPLNVLDRLDSFKTSQNDATLRENKELKMQNTNLRSRVEQLELMLLQREQELMNLSQRHSTLMSLAQQHLDSSENVSRVLTTIQSTTQQSTSHSIKK